jgi:predicted TIM-barrel fold metal-dependent hydrolase
VPVSLAAAMFLPTVGKIAERHPGLKLIVDHMGVPRASRGESAYRFQPELLALAKYPNVAVKATGQAATPKTSIRSGASTRTSIAASMRSVPNGCSGAPTSPGCNAPGGNA